MEEYSKSPATLFVDLDGTFTKSDMLFESLIIAIKNNPFVVFFCCFWLIRGKGYLKHQLAQRADIKTKTLPLNKDFYEFLLSEKADGKKIVLATASNEKYAQSVCNDYEIFDSYISSDIYTNLQGKAKLDRIQSINKKFSYAGNSEEDFIIFQSCEESYLVNPTKKAKKLESKFPTTRTFDDSDVSKLVWVKQIRVHQWLKNLLIFVPLVVSGKFLDINSILFSALGFISFSFLASATYIVNDLFDLEADRSHIRKKYRPLAAGKISLKSGKIAAITLFVLALSIASYLNVLFNLVLIIYLALTLTYSFKIKQYIGLDVIALASLYTARIIAGAVILGVTMSFWLLSFSMFIFLSLAIVKRCAELKLLIQSTKVRASGRDYNVEDYMVLLSIGISSAMLSILMFSFYVNNNVLIDQYQQPTLLWLILPALSYWIMRMWIKTHRGEMYDDPIVFSIKDKGSIVTVVFMGFIALLAQLL